MISRPSPPSSDALGLNRSVYIGYIPPSFSEKELAALASPFGEVVAAHVKRNIVDGASLCYGFVKMATFEQAAAVIQQLHQSCVQERTIAVHWAYNSEAASPGPAAREDKDKDSAMAVPTPVPVPAHHTNSVFVYFRFHRRKGRVNKDVLRALCSEFGRVLGVRIKSLCCMEEDVMCGYGFVHFEASLAGMAAVKNCIDSCHRNTIQNVFYKFEPSTNFFQFGESLLAALPPGEDKLMLQRMLAEMEAMRFSRSSEHCGQSIANSSIDELDAFPGPSPPASPAYAGHRPFLGAWHGPGAPVPPSAVYGAQPFLPTATFPGPAPVPATYVFYPCYAPQPFYVLSQPPVYYQ